MQIYTTPQVEEKLKTIDGWVLVNSAIEKQYKFKDFKASLEFINQVGIIAEIADHHHEIYNIYNRVKLSLRTHSANGITNKDFDLAQKIDSIT